MEVHDDIIGGNCTKQYVHVKKIASILRHNEGANEAKKKVRNVGNENKLLGKNLFKVV